MVLELITFSKLKLLLLMANSFLLIDLATVIFGGLSEVEEAAFGELSFLSPFVLTPYLPLDLPFSKVYGKAICALT
jgi:hypothetical protein